MSLGKPKKLICMYALNKTAYNEFHATATQLTQRFDVKIVILLNKIYFTKKDFEQIIPQKNISFVTLGGEFEAITPPKKERDSGSQKSKLSKFIPTKAKKLIINASRLFAENPFFIRKKAKKIEEEIITSKKACHDVLKEYKPDSFVFYGDRHINVYELELLEYCKKNKIPSFVLSFTAHSFKKELLYNMPTSLEFNASIHPIARRKFENMVGWSKKRKKHLWYTPLKNILALHKQGILPKNPWCIGASACDFIMADSDAKKQLLIENGVAPHKVKVTGLKSHDDLYETLKNKEEIRKRITINSRNPNGKNIIVSLPQLAEHGDLDWKEHWIEIEFICESLMNTNANIFVSLHPKTDINQYLYLEEKYQLNIVKEPLSKVIVAADLFIAAFSSTVFWAVLCEIPSIVLDLYGFHYDIFDQYKGIEVIREKKSLKDSVKNLLENNELYIQRVNHLRLERKELSPFQGKCIEQMAKELSIVE